MAALAARLVWVSDGLPLRSVTDARLDGPVVRRRNQTEEMPGYPDVDRAAVVVTKLPHDLLDVPVCGPERTMGVNCGCPHFEGFKQLFATVGF